ncbi:MAG: hypothetical protein ACP5N3_00165 [Candidatus Nanoarchaeia archaeon]
MDEEYGFWNRTDYNLGFMQQYVELFIYSALAFLVPFTLGHPQLIVGILVNAALVLAALNLKDYKLLPVIMLPSIAVLSRGMIFGPFTIFLIYMIPFIWIGNIILVYAFKELKLKRKMNSIVTLIIGAGAKTLFLFLCALLLVKTGMIPAPFLVSMGVLQLYTALLGGILALGIHETKKRVNAAAKI